MGESVQRPLELCRWEDLEALPSTGNEYQQLYKLVDDRLLSLHRRLLMLPLSLLKTAQGHPVLIELKTGDTYNGHLVLCDTWMNVHLREVIYTSKNADQFWRMPEVFLRGNTIKYIGVPDEVWGSAHTSNNQPDQDAVAYPYWYAVHAVQVLEKVKEESKREDRPSAGRGRGGRGWGMAGRGGIEGSGNGEGGRGAGRGTGRGGRGDGARGKGIAGVAAALAEVEGGHKPNKTTGFGVGGCWKRFRVDRALSYPMHTLSHTHPLCKGQSYCLFVWLMA
ncbi:hypothetical protein QJQ45_018836 [Haematococcus lacustris]|nr:hypothetical protein QJQ45_018836 [Haematococcus lacustris]